MNRKQQPKINRRALLRTLLTTATGALLAACGPPRGGEEVGRHLALGPHATPQIALPSPAPVTPVATSALEREVVEFLALSTLLTGVTNLSPDLGRVYLRSLQSSADFDVTVAELVEQAGLRGDEPPATLSAVESTGIFEQEQTRRLADKITEMWYTGIYTDEAGEEVVATFVDALAWQTLRFTKPLTLCGAPGFWAQAWTPPQEG